MHTRIESLRELAQKLGLDARQMEMLLAELRNALVPAVFVHPSMEEGPIKVAIGKTINRIFQLVICIQEEGEGEGEGSAPLALEVVADEGQQDEGPEAQNDRQSYPDSITRVRCRVNTGPDAAEVENQQGEGEQLRPDAHRVISR